MRSLNIEIFEMSGGNRKCCKRHATLGSKRICGADLAAGRRQGHRHLTLQEWKTSFQDCEKTTIWRIFKARVEKGDERCKEKAQKVSIWITLSPFFGCRKQFATTDKLISWPRRRECWKCCTQHLIFTKLTYVASILKGSYMFIWFMAG